LMMSPSLFEGMSRGLAEVEGEDASLSDTVDSDVELDNQPDAAEETAVYRQADAVSHTIELPAANGHLPDHEYAAAAPSVPVQNESNKDSRDMSQKARERYYATLLATMDDMELDRYEAYRRSCLPRPKMKKLLSSLSNFPVHDDKILIVLCSLAKMFVGQIVQESRSVASSMGDSGPLRPQHIRRAFKKLESEGAIVRRSFMRSLFRHVA